MDRGWVLILVSLGFLLILFFIALFFIIKRKLKYPLHSACESGNNKKFIKLIRKNVNINLQDNNGNSLLFCAMSGGNIDIIKYLIDFGIDINAANKMKRTALHEGKWSNGEAVKLLIEKGADINARDELGNTPLLDIFATRFGKIPNILEIVKALVEGGSDVNAMEYAYKDTSLHRIAAKGKLPERYEIVEYLIKHGADVNAKNEMGTTPLDIAKGMWDSKMKKILIENGALEQ